MKVCKTLNYIEHLLILASKVTEGVPISVFASLVVIPADIGSPSPVIPSSNPLGGFKVN